MNIQCRLITHKVYLHVCILCRNCLLRTRYWRRDRRKCRSDVKTRKKMYAATTWP